MNLSKTWLSLALVLSLVGCGSDDSSQNKIKDAAPSTDDAAVRNDAPAQDQAVDRVADGPAADQAREQGLDSPVAADSSPDVSTEAASPDSSTQATSETGTDPYLGDAGTPADAAGGFPCREDSDCCIAIDSCINASYLYSVAPGAAPKPTIPTGTGQCTSCIPPAIQVRCMQNQCVGERVSGYEQALTVPHCGPVNLGLDGGPTSNALPVDASTASPTKSVWHCGD